MTQGSVSCSVRIRTFFWHLLDKRLVSVLLLMPLPLWALSPLDSYIQEAMANNPNLAQAQFEVQAEQERLANLRARFYPSLSLQARASVSEGGRTIDFPAGDLLNPVYATLNAQAVAAGQPARFPTVQNQSIPLLRPTEQDTRLILRGPIYEPALDSQVQAQNNALNAQLAAQQQIKEELARDLKTAYWQYAQAQSRIQVLQGSLQTLQENERVNQTLYKAGETTLDVPRRAQAETLEVKVGLQQAQTQALLAREYFNLLRHAPEQSEVNLPSEQFDTDTLSQVLDTLRPTDNATSPPPALTRLEMNLAAQRAQLQASQASFKPTLGYSIEGGYQGRDYSTGPDTGFATASVVLNWTLADAGIRNSEVARAQAQVNALQAKAAQVTRQLALAKLQAKENLLVSLSSIEARTAQRDAAEESLRITVRKRDAGETTPVEFLSAEQSATRARMGLISAVYQARIDHAIWQYNNRNIAQPSRLEGATQ